MFFKIGREKMNRYTIFIEWGYEVADSSGWGDVAVGEAFKTVIDLFPFQGSYQEAKVKAQELIKERQPCFGWWITEGEREKHNFDLDKKIESELKHIAKLAIFNEITKNVGIASYYLMEYNGSGIEKSEEEGILSVTGQGLEETIRYKILRSSSPYYLREIKCTELIDFKNPIWYNRAPVTWDLSFRVRYDLKLDELRKIRAEFEVRSI